MPRVRKGDVQWVEPQLVAQVRFGEWTHDDHLRHPRYLGLRDDKSAGEVTREQPIADVVRAAASASCGSRISTSRSGPTRGSPRATCSRYYQAIAPVARAAPRGSGRSRCGAIPTARTGRRSSRRTRRPTCPTGSRAIRTLVSTRDKARTKKWIEFPVVDDELGLLWMVNMGCIDMNTWYSRVDKPDRPDFVPLRPRPDAGGAVGADDRGGADPQGAARPARPRLVPEDLRRQGLPRPRAARPPLDVRRQSRAFAEVVAGAIARTHPKLATTEWSKARRRGVLIDSNQNGEGKTIASVYSVRPKPNAPVSTPLRWDEVDDKLNPSIYTMPVVLERVRTLGDVYADLLTTRQSLTKALKTLEQ